jgi:hypothetical protein
MPEADDDLEYLTFAIDAGSTSGWAVADGNTPDDVLESGISKKPEHRRDACAAAKGWQANTGLPLIVVAEDWPGKWRSWKSALGIGRQWGMWVDHIHFTTGVKEGHILRVNPARWRNDLYGPEMVREAQGHQDGMRKLAVSFAGVADHNEAEARCIAIWAHQSFAGQASAEAALKRLRKQKK